jgi:integrase
LDFAGSVTAGFVCLKQNKYNTTLPEIQAAKCDLSKQAAVIWAMAQKGRIYRKGRSWILAYGVKVQKPNGVAWAWRSKKLAPVCDEFRSPASVRHLALEILGPLNTKTARPESTDTVAHFLEHVYLPYCQANLRPSTHAGYTFLFKMLKPHLGNYRLRDFGAVEGERLLTDFANEKRRAHSVLKNTKGFLSGAFRYAVRTGTLRFNPMRETMLPKSGKPLQSGRAYSLAEIQGMLDVLAEPARTAILVAALTGLRSAEIRGLRWEDFTGKELRVRRSVWRTHIGETKTPGSAAAIPVLPVLAKAIELHRSVSTGPFIFSGTTGKPLVLANVTRRLIAPELVKAKIDWRGWHGLRRGLASTLYELAVPDKVIQQILRHANVSTTMKHYVKTSSGQAESAMKKLAKAFDRTQNRTQK